MKITDFADHDSLVSQYMLELRDRTIQKDPMRFRRNLERMGQIMAYEISRTLGYCTVRVDTPLAAADCRRPAAQPVLATIMRAGIPFHQGFLDYFDGADNAFVSAYRHYTDGDNFEVCIEYLASPSIEGRTLIITDPMLATGTSMELSYRALLTRGEPAHIHIASVIASRQAIEYVRGVFPGHKTSLWVGAIDPGLNPHKYIVPGLGDAGDLAYGEKL